MLKFIELRAHEREGKGPLGNIQAVAYGTTNRVGRSHLDAGGLVGRVQRSQGGFNLVAAGLANGIHSDTDRGGARVSACGGESGVEETAPKIQETWVAETLDFGLFVRRANRLDGLLCDGHSAGVLGLNFDFVSSRDDRTDNGSAIAKSDVQRGG